MTRILVCLAALTALLASAGERDAGAGRAADDCSIREGWPAPRLDLAAEVVRLVNAHRRSRGLTALKVSPALSRSSAWKASHMARYRYMRHDDPAPPVARSAAERARACGYPVGTAVWGENIASGYRTVEAVMSAWLRSRGHRMNIESRRYTAIGVGAATTASGAVAWVQNFGSLVDPGARPPARGRPRARAIPGKRDRVAPSAPTVEGPRQTWDPRPAYRFSSTDRRTPASRLRYRCSFDSPRLRPCAARHSEPLTLGRHLLRVQAIDASGNASRVTTVAVVILAAADLELTKTAFATGTGQLVYALVVSNRGPWPAEHAVVTDALPAGTTRVSAGAAQGGCTGETTITCDLGTIAPSANTAVTITVDASPGVLVNTASVSSATLDPEPVNNTATVVTSTFGRAAGPGGWHERSHGPSAVRRAR